MSLPHGVGSVVRGSRLAADGHLGPDEIAADVVVAGASLGGCAAALAALRADRHVVLVAAYDWIGGQLTTQAVPPDEHPWIEQFGTNRSYRRLRRTIREHYRRFYRLSQEARADSTLNPGNGSVSRLCHEPRAALAALRSLMAPHLSSGRLSLLEEHEPIEVEVQGDRVLALVVREARTGTRRTLRAPYILDATELGDLLPMAGVEHVVGAEGRDETNEPHAADQADALNQQALTACFAVEFRPGESHVIDRPEGYDFWRNYQPALEPAWPGPLLSWTYSHPPTLRPRTASFDPRSPGEGFWRYRRIIDPLKFEPGTYAGGISLINWPQNDYWLGPLVGVDQQTANKHIAQAKQLSLSMLYWLQTEAPREDGGTGWPELRLRPDLVGTHDGLAKEVYVRESRRIRAEFTVTEWHVGLDARRMILGLGPDASVSSELFPDSIGVGAYRIDLHPSTGGDNYIDFSSLPFQIPLGALVPIRVENLIPACKNIGTTHVTNGCYRLHPVEWSIGEAAGALAAFCLEVDQPPCSVLRSTKFLEQFQGRLRDQGVELTWPEGKTHPL